jgi:hypothetical protein
MISEAEKERRMVFARQRAALAWCKETTSHIEMDVLLAEAFAELLVNEMYAPHLGCASTRDILDELLTRLGVDLDYKTVPDEGPDHHTRLCRNIE